MRFWTRLYPALVTALLSACAGGGGGPVEPLPGLVVDPVSLTIPEGGTARFAVRLDGAPPGDMLIEARIVDASGTFRVVGAASVTFTHESWADPRYVTIESLADDNATDETAEIEILSGGERAFTIAVVQSESPLPPPPPPPPLPQHDVPITVKDAAGVGATDTPMTAVVPLPYGQYQNTSTFRLVDASGAPVPAQFEVVNRWWARDGSLRHVAVHFDATVGANGATVYTFQTNGAGPTPAKPVAVSEAADSITVDTGPLRFTVRKSGFNLLDEVWLDGNGDGSFTAAERVVAPGSPGAVFTGRLDVQRDSDRTGLRIDVEESGPVRAVLRVSAPTIFNSTTDHTHGWAVRIHAYAGKSYVKVDYQLQNSPKTATYWPLYFEDLALGLKPELAGPTARLATGPGNVWSGVVGDGRHLFQSSFVDSAVRSGAGTTVLSTGTNQPSLPSYGWADLSDAQRGLFVAVRHMAEMWPNAIEFESDGTVQVRLWPKWSAQWHEGRLSPSGLYWLEDMQHVVKEVLFYFHGPSASSGELTRLAQNFQYHPVPFIDPAIGFETRATLDLDGILPSPEPLDLPDETRITYSSSRLNPASVFYNFGWMNFGGDMTRKDTREAGDWPDSASELYGGANRVGRWLSAEARAWGEINCRPMWLAEYTDTEDFERLYPSSESGKNWRAYDSIPSGPAAPYLADTSWTRWHAAANSHCWMYHVEEFYYASYNLWILDWYRYVAEFRKGERSLLTIPSGMWGGNMDANKWSYSRNEAHSIAHTLHAYRATGDAAVLDHLKFRFAHSVEGRRLPQYGIWRVEGEGETAFQVGFLARAMIDLLAEIRGRDADWEARIFHIIWGIVDWNQNLSRYAYTYLDSRTAVPGATQSAGSATQLCDPSAWFFLQTGNTAVRDLLWQYIDTGVNGGNTAYGPHRVWNGDYIGRLTAYLTNHPWTPAPPAAIQDLSATYVAGKVRLEWTTPARAKRFHIVWSTLPIAASYDRSALVRNVWASNPVGQRLAGVPGTRQSIEFPATGARIYAAVYSFDAENAMSPISNVADVAP
jgi:hypothetical protein